ncbi:MAG: cyclic lactone autoinducer peptide [Eubacteriales bacterium]|nr:cyclic lactone autoinducer peptide [Eubacteriales bacterium]
MKNTIKTAMLNLTAKVALETAKQACGAASWFDCYQPKEPKALKKMMNKK